MLLFQLIIYIIYYILRSVCVCEASDSINTGSRSTKVSCSSTSSSIKKRVVALEG